MGRALYRSYRSKSFDEVVGQEHITETLKNSLKNGTFSHAYLFTGSRGVGKTSVARILAHAVNNAPYPPTAPEVDIIEIDAASNRRIDEIRELRERIAIAPTSLKYKVYIVDEVHMLTKEAFNALLKTLEEPPDHAIFILATTDIHKVPDTIVSRCLRFHFKPISSKNMLPHLRSIAKNEKIAIDDEALVLLAVHSDGSFRDAIALLDQLRGYGGELDKDTVSRQLGLGSAELITSIVDSVEQGDIKSILENIKEAESQGVHPNLLTSQLIDRYKKDLQSRRGPLDVTEIVKLIDELVAIPASTNEVDALEVALMKTAVKATDTRTKANETEQEYEPLPQELEPQPTTSEEKIPEESVISPLDDAPQEKNLLPGNSELWEEILKSLKNENSSLYSIARMAKIETTQNKLILKFRFAFHYKRMNTARNKQNLEELARKVIPAIESIEVIQIAEPTNTSEKTDESIQTITNIFGSGEVLES